MKLPYGYVLIGKEIVIHEEKADVVRSIFDDYLAGASLGKFDFRVGMEARSILRILLANREYGGTE